MDKIYSRKRIKIPNIKYSCSSEKKTLRKTFKTAIIVIIAVLVFWTIFNSISPLLEELCKNKARSISTIISNDQATKVMSRYDYDDLVTIHKGESNNITMVESNIIVMNEIISDIAIKIQEDFNNMDSQDLYIRLGTFTGSKILSGRGPKIPIRISSIGEVLTDFKSEFTSAGVNQTLHRVFLEVKCRVSILTPFNTIDEEIINQVILAENIIVGKIPETYYNLEGMTEGDALEVME